MNMGTSVKVKEIGFITPSAPTPTHTLQLSALDSQLFLRFTIEYLLIYRPCRNLDKSTIRARVKGALSRALVSYYPLAGRVKTRPDSSGLDVICRARAQGAVFIEAVAGISISEFEKAPCYVSERRKLLSLHVDDVLKRAPPLVVQLTWLADGAVALGVGFSHCICDGVGSAEFLNSFAELARLGDCKAKPVWDRHLVDQLPVHATRINSVTHPEFDRVIDLCEFNSRFLPEMLTPTSVTFSNKSLFDLKKLAKSTSRLSESKLYTSFEVLSAHIWRAWAKALDCPPNQILRLLFSIDIRKRVEPSLPSGFYGNAMVLGCAETSVKDLTEKGLGYATELVKRAKERVDTEYVRDVVKLVSQTRASPDSVGVLILSQWSRLGLESVDFGMGRPVHVGPICCDRYCLLLPVPDQPDAVKVMLAVPTYGVDKYKSLLTNYES